MPRLKFLIVLLLITASLFLLLPSPARAFVFDLASNQLEALSEKTAPFLMYTFKLFVYYLVSLMLLMFSANLLESVLMETPQMLDLGSNMVTTGWAFTMGIANLFLIIAFVVIAFATILKMEPYGLKKALPKLIIVALLINFSLLFVKIGVDVVNFVFTTLLNNIHINPTGPDISIFTYTLNALYQDGFNTVVWYITWSIALTSAMLIPYINVAVQAGLIFGLPLFLPIIFRTLIYAVIMFLLAMIFLLYAVIFLARVFIIQILAIFSPLAFVCLIFPATQKYWKLWLKYLTEWLLAGVFFLFLLILAFGIVLPDLDDFSNIVDTTIQHRSIFVTIINFLVGGGLIYYLILLVFMIVVIAVCRKLIPSSAQAIINQGGSFLKNTAAPFARSYFQGLTAASTKIAAETNRQKQNEAAMTTGEKKAMRAQMTRGERARRRVAGIAGATFGGWGRAATRLSGSTLEMEANKIIEQEHKKYKEKYGENINAAAEVEDRFEQKGKKWMASSLHDAAKLKYFSETGGDKGVKKMNDQEIKRGLEAINAYGSSKELKRLFIHKKIDDMVTLDKNLNEAVIKKLHPDNMKEKTVQEMIKKDIRINGESIQAALRSKNQALAQRKILEKARRVEAVKSMNAADIKKLSSETLAAYSPDIARFNSKLVPSIQEEHGQEVVDSIRESMKILGWKEIARTNATLLRQIITNPLYKSLIPMDSLMAKNTDFRRDFQGLEDKEKLEKISEYLNQFYQQQSNSNQDETDETNNNSQDETTKEPPDSTERETETKEKPPPNTETGP